MKSWADHRIFYVYYFCGIFFLFQMVRGLNRLCLSHLGDVFIFQPRQDPLVWLYAASGIPAFILGNQAFSVGFDILVYTLPVLLFFTQEKRLYKFAWLFFIIYSVYPEYPC